jgi:hypothetical protein
MNFFHIKENFDFSGQLFNVTLGEIVPKVLIER